MDPLVLLARAFDTKGYPDDKNPDHWKTINHAPTHIDENGNIDGGAGGKFHGKPWTSTKHPHKPESYPKKPLESLAEATKPAVTGEDLEAAWAKVVKYKVAMNQSKSEKTYQKHSQNLLNAIDKYKELYNEAGPDVPKKKHNAEAMVKHANKAWSELPKNQTNQDPLNTLASLDPFEVKEVEGTVSTSPAPTNPNAPNGAYTPDPGSAVNTSIGDYKNYCTLLQTSVSMYEQGYADEYTLDKLKNILDKYVNSTNYDDFSLDEKKQIWKQCGSKSEYINTVKKAQDIVAQNLKISETNANINQNPLESLSEAVAGKDLTPATKLSDGSTWGNMAPIKFTPVTDAEKNKHPLAPSFQDMDVHKKIIGTCSNVWNGLMVKEKEALYEYTQSFSKFNEPLRGCIYGQGLKNYGPGNVDLDMIGVNGYGHFEQGEVKKLITDMTEAINESSYGEPMTLRRDCPISLFETLCNLPQGTFAKTKVVDKLRSQLEGNNFTDNGFCSCGIAKGKGLNGYDKIDMEIYTPAGTKMMYMEPFSYYGGKAGWQWDGKDNLTHIGGEGEMLLQRGTKFKIDHLSYENGKWHVKVQVIAQEPFEIK